MKKYAPYVILFLLAVMLCDALSWNSGMTYYIDGDEFDGPLGWLLGALFAGGGTLLGLFIAVVVTLVLAVVFAGVGVILLGAVGIGALVVALAISPLLLPLLIPVAVVWYLMSRSRKVRLEKAAAV